MNNSISANAKARKPLPKAKRLFNSAMLQRGGAGGPQTGFTCNPCVQTENDQCFYTKGICPSVNRC